MDLSHVDYLWIIVMFLSALVLTAPIHCRIILGTWGRVHFHFWVNYFYFFINRGNNITMSAFLLCLTDHNVSSLVFVGKAPLFDSNLTWHQELLIQPCSQSQLLMTSRESGAVKVCAVWKRACNTALKFPQNHYLGLFPNRVMGNTE